MRAEPSVCSNPGRRTDAPEGAPGVLKHAQKLQRIADANGGTRASGTPGYDASADYVADKPRAAGYDVTIQPFTFPFFQELADARFEQVSPTARSYVLGTDFLTMEYSGSGDVTASVVPTNDVVIAPDAAANTSNSGCEASDFPAETAGKVALVQRGTCTFALKAQNAEAAGAAES